MTEQRKKLLERFDKWLDSNPRKQIISAQCANIAEEYAEEQLRLHFVSQQRELLVAFNERMAEEHCWFLPAEDYMIDDFLSNQ